MVQYQHYEWLQLLIANILSAIAMEARELNVGDLLGLLESPQEEVCHEVRALLKETFSSVREPWLISGLLEYFYVSNR